MSQRTALLLVIMLAGVAPAFAQNDAEGALKQFEGKVLVLRHPLRNKSLTYNFNGDLLTTTKDKDAGSWTAYGGILIENVSVAPDKLILQGHRIIFLFNNSGIIPEELKGHKNHHGSPPFSPDVHIEIKLDQALVSAAQARDIMKNLFALDTDHLMEAAKGLWAQLLKDHLVYDSSLPRDQEFLWQATEKKQNAAEQDVASKGHNGEIITHVTPNGPVKPPRPIYTPAPEFTDLARFEEFEGVVVLTIIVGTDGHVHNARVIRPLGMGLDETAQETITKWRFDPAKKDGESVAIEMNVETTFDLH